MVVKFTEVYYDTVWKLMYCMQIHLKIRKELYIISIQINCQLYNSTNFHIDLTRNQRIMCMTCDMCMATCACMCMSYGHSGSVLATAPVPEGGGEVDDKVQRR